MTAVALGEQIYVAGGFVEDQGTVPLVEVYDIATDSWSTGPDLPLALNHAMSARIGGIVYVLGGYAGPGLDKPSDRVFALIEGVWVEGPPMPEVRAAGGAAGIGGNLYVAGGVGPDGLSDSTMVFDPATQMWSTIEGVPTQRQHLGVARYRGRLYVVGGRHGGLGGNLAAAERYATKKAKWSAMPDLPTARGGLAAAATTNGFIVAPGGEEHGATFEEVEAFDVEGKKWRTLPPLPTPRHGLGVVAVGTVVYVIAGGPEPGLHFSDANEAIDLAPLRD